MCVHRIWKDGETSRCWDSATCESLDATTHRQIVPNFTFSHTPLVFFSRIRDHRIGLATMIPVGFRVQAAMTRPILPHVNFHFLLQCGITNYQRYRSGRTVSMLVAFISDMHYSVDDKFTRQALWVGVRYVLRKVKQWTSSQGQMCKDNYFF